LTHKTNELEVKNESGQIPREKHIINSVATTFYKNLFGHSNNSHISMRNLDMNGLNEGDRDALTAPFSMQDIMDTHLSLKRIIHEVKITTRAGRLMIKKKALVINGVTGLVFGLILDWSRSDSYGRPKSPKKLNFFLVGVIVASMEFLNPHYIWRIIAPGNLEMIFALTISG
ncbi:hypothetical protein ACJX0J_020720, partial [Zea mays]